MKLSKKLINLCLLAFLTIGFPSAAQAGKDKPIAVSQLPVQAQQTLRTYFAGKKVALAKKETDLFSKSYDVLFTDGSKIEFRGNGTWKEIDCKRGRVPDKMVPAPIRRYVATHYRGHVIRKIEHDNRCYEIKLSSGMEITFDNRYNVIDIDN